VGSAIDAITNIAAFDFGATAPTGVAIRRVPNAGDGFDFCQFLHGLRYLPERDGCRFDIHPAVPTWFFNIHIPDVLITEAERLAIVVAQINGGNHDAEEHQKRDEDFKDDQEVNAL